MSPKFTIVTPSFNQANFLPRTLSSIEEQSYKEYEHLIYDPGSTDGSLEISESYCRRNPRARLFKGIDKSQTNAVNLGFREAKGEILCWLNSDDRYATKDTLESVAVFFDQNPGTDIVYGRGTFLNENGDKIKEAFVHRDGDRLRTSFANSLGVLQPSLFMRASVFHGVGEFDEKMNFSFDYEYWARCAAFGVKFKFFDKLISEAVIHQDAKTIKARGISLEESSVVANRYYDFVSIDWIKRIVDHQVNGADGITTVNSEFQEESLSALFCEKNLNSRAVTSFLNTSSLMNDETRNAFRSWVIPSFTSVYISAWDANYFDMGVTLISSIHRHDPGKWIFVCDIGMTEAQKSFLKQLRNVAFLEKDFPEYSADWQREPKNYVFKNILFQTAAKLLSPGACLLWIDAGVALCEKPTEIFDLIATDGSFFIDHDDSRHWPLYNASFTSDEAIIAANFTWSEMSGPHVISCLFGYKIGGPFSQLFDEAAKLAHIKDVAVGDKHPPESQKRMASGKEHQIERAEILKPSRKHVDDLVDLRRIFGYYGHRQDQSILSALATRFGAKISSAKKFCPANEVSSEVSKQNWFEGISKQVGRFSRADGFSVGVTFHHRGLIKDFSGLEFDLERQSICAVLGNGPSLADVDVTAFSGIDSIGMNAAYRYWNMIGWYPKYYCCLDTVVGMSHKEAILDLVRHRRRYGITQFVIRQNLFDWLSERGQTDGVVCFDLIREGFELLHPDPVTTGSHSHAWAVVLGYRRMIVAGVDCNYVEHVVGSSTAADETLEITSEDRNPNYVFSGYQKVGDKYNIPNPSKDLHIRSWRNVGAALPENVVSVNVSRVSRMDAFPKMPLADAIKVLQARGQLDREPFERMFDVFLAMNQDTGSSGVSPEVNDSEFTRDTFDSVAVKLASELLLGLKTPNEAHDCYRTIIESVGRPDRSSAHLQRVYQFILARQNAVSTQ